MKTSEAVAGDKSHSTQALVGRIHNQAFTRWLAVGFPSSESDRVRINSREARALLIDMG